MMTTTQGQTVTVAIGAAVFAVSLLKLGDLKACGDAIGAVKDFRPGDMPRPEMLEAMESVVYASIARAAKINGTEAQVLSREAFHEHVDGLDYDTGGLELAKAFGVAMTRSGFEKLAGGSAPASSGEALPVESTSPVSTG